MDPSNETNQQLKVAASAIKRFGVLYLSISFHFDSVWQQKPSHLKVHLVAFNNFPTVSLSTDEHFSSSLAQILSFKVDSLTLSWNSPAFFWHISAKISDLKSITWALWNSGMHLSLFSDFFNPDGTINCKNNRADEWVMKIIISCSPYYRWLYCYTRKRPPGQKESVEVGVVRGRQQDNSWYTLYLYHFESI